MTNNICEICDGTGVDPNSGNVCSCMIQKALDNFLGANFSDVTISDKLKNMTVDESMYHIDIYFNAGIRPDKLANSNNRIPVFEFVKLYLVHKFLYNPEYSFWNGTGTDIFNAYMGTSIAEQNEVIMKDLFIISIGNNVTNTYLKELLPYVLNERKLKGKQNFVIWTNTHIDDPTKRTEYIKNKYGEEMYTYLSTQVRTSERHIRYSKNKIYLLK